MLRDTETASTWTVAGADLAASIWPRLLRTDASGNGGRVRTGIRVVSKAIPFLVLLCAITSIVTPIGLGQELRALPPTAASFQYAKDQSPYGQGTSQRGRHEFSRECTLLVGLGIPLPCPYSDSKVDIETNETGYRFEVIGEYNYTIPSQLREIFSSGTTAATTVSNFFDIEWRQLSRVITDLRGKKPHDVGMFRQLDSFILDNSYKLVEGLVIDAKTGGVGFRNHTIPVGLLHGATWEEDLLFVEPVTECVNTNLTFEFEMTSNDSEAGGIRKLFIRDQGGFAKLNTTRPQLDHPNAQSNPDLAARAYKAAWLNNALTMLYMNVTNPKDEAKGVKSFSYMNSEVGKAFQIPYSAADSYDGLSLSAEFGKYLHLETTGRFTLDGVFNYSNPFNISTRDFSAVPLLCSGAGKDDIANISNIYVGCSLVRGAPKRTDGGDAYLFEDGSKWSSSMHVCASAVRATIKTVHFVLNGTDANLSGLRVQSISPKTYPDPADHPLWGLEDSGLSLGGISPLWGVLSPEHASRPNVSSTRQPHFHLPGYSSGASAAKISAGTTMRQNLPGATFAQMVMTRVVGMADDAWPFDYSGGSSVALFTRWQALSSDAAGAAEVLNLMWTDLAASAVVGTRAGADVPSQQMVRPVGSRITYDVRFGIPAAFLLLALGIVVVLACGTTCFGRGGMGALRTRIGQLSAGRVFTTFLYPDESTLTMRPRQWREVNGLKVVTVGLVARPGDGGPGEEQYIYARGGGQQGEVYGMPGLGKQ